MNKLKLLWIDVKSRFEVIYLPNFKNFLYFQELAWKTLVGKWGIISGRDVRSKGGYKFQQIEISKLPLSKT